MARKTITFFIVLFAICIFVLSTKNKAVQTSLEQRVDQYISLMSIDEKVGQLIMPAVPVDNVDEEQIERNIRDFRVGGYHFLIGKKVLHSSMKTRALIERMQAASKLPLLIAADFEGGVGFYFKDGTRVPRAMAIGATFDEEMSYRIGYLVAKESREMGFNVNFYPDVDVNSNSKNPIINIRSFGGEAEVVAKMARAYVRGFSEGQGIAVAKHFPGHGDTVKDSHLMLPSINADWTRLSDIELKPFDACIEEGVPAIMSAHITLPAFAKDNLPATLSKEILTGLLKNRLNFQGLIFTDAMMMGGIAKNYPEGKTSVMAIKAGADIILYPVNVEESFKSIKQAVLNGEISEARLNESVRKVLTAKASLYKDISGDVGEMNDYKFSNKASDDFQDVSNDSHKKLANQVIQSAITLVKDDEGILPLELSKNKKLVILNVLDAANGWREGTPGKHLYQELKDKYPQAENLYFTDKTSSTEVNLIKNRLMEADLIIIAGFIRVSAFKGSIEFTNEQVDLLKSLADLKKPSIMIMFGNPYAISALPKMKTFVLAYENYSEAEVAVANCLLGRHQFLGKLPVEISSMPFGHSVI
ncbi:MAG: glycoside hydrolase family 3 N-terminal domain-containing protein [Candidatus Caenarcaniphilales bacterium]|nr:glycoside hydrolase family 3 N-terminal domain-containing protein [Candidatus Caenarcaniphilales bacterium]